MSEREDTVEFILRVRMPLSKSRGIEKFLTNAAQQMGASLSRIQREEHGTHALHKSRKMLVR